MNKFLKKRPTEALVVNDEALSALSQPPSPASKKPSASRWKKSKKPAQTKPQLDLAFALPPTDDFRTSLIMPSLSTRFSMLREQDDPNSKLGKASDDSVLQPRRKSRMTDFGYGSSALFDIAEVSTFNGSMRAPFAHETRQHSFVSEEGYSSDADTQSGSIMTRSRPGEGNILFGGRQKIYKIPTTGAHTTGGLGRLVYDDDVGMSTFQKYRAREREVDQSQFPRASEESQGFDFGLDQAELGAQDERFTGLDSLANDSAKDLSQSPSLSSYDKKRSTTSSTARSDARSSTAATSIASQTATSAQPSPAHGPLTTTTTNGITTSVNGSSPTPVSAMSLERSNTKSRRLYEQGLDQHMQEQQTSAMSRLNSIQRHRGMSIKNQQPYLHSTRSASNLHDRNPPPVYAVRTQSPPLTSPPPLNTSIRNANSATSSPAMSGPHSPVDQWDDNKVLTQALEPGDRGKATAMGAFNKPAHAFDEQQYLERQKALQRSNSTAVVKNKAATQNAVQNRLKSYETERQNSPSPDIAGRARSRSVAKKHDPSKAYNVFQNAVQQFPGKASAPTPKAPLPDTHRTFFGDINASEDEDEDEDSQSLSSVNAPEYGFYNTQGRWQPTQLQSVSEHPALRSQKSKASVPEERDDRDTSPYTFQSSSQPNYGQHQPSEFAPHAPLSSSDSAGLEPQAQAQAMNGIVHHLRQESNHSSVYPADEVSSNEHNAPGDSWEPKNLDLLGHNMGNRPDAPSVSDSSYATSNPWDLHEQNTARAPAANRNFTVSPIDVGPGLDVSSIHQAQHPDVSPVTDRKSKRRPTLVRKESDNSLPAEDLPSWQQELHKQHTRDASTATQQERDAFANELAARRAAIQENMKSMVERDTHSRGNSPGPGPLKALGMLRAKSSRESIAHAHDAPPKVAKVLGAPRGSSPNLASQAERPGVSLDLARPRGQSSTRPPLPTSQHPAFKPDGPGPSAGPVRDVDSTQAERILASSRSASTQATRGRSRSNSAATAGRSRSRTGPYRDDLEKAMVEGHGSSAAAYTPDLSPFPSASPDLTRSDWDFDGGKTTTTNYFDPPSATSGRLPSAGQASVTQSPHVYTRGRPFPVASAHHPTPPSSAGPSPISTSNTYVPIVPSSARPGPGLRRKTISKHDISEPTLISSTSNVDTVDLPEGASLRNGMGTPPPIPPINPRRRATRKLFSRGRSDSAGDHEPRVTASDPNLLSNTTLNTSPKREYHFPPSNVVRMPTVSASRDHEKSPAMQQYGFGPGGSPERTAANPRTGAMQRAVTAPLNSGMF